MGFPKQVNVQAAPAVAGDWCDRNPRFFVDAGAGAFVAGTTGLTIGRFAWADANNITLNSTGVGAPTGFIHREQQGLITAYLAEAGIVIPPGMGATACSGAGVWALNSGSTTSAIGNVAYANNGTGAVSFDVAGNPPTSASVTGSIAMNTSTAGVFAVNSVTGSILSTTLTVTAIGTGCLAPGQFLSGGSGANIVDPATMIVSQLTGTAGSTGTYQLSVSQTVTSTTIVASGGCLTVGGTITGTFAVGQTITGASVAAGTTITALGSGAGGAGTYATSVAQTIGSEAVTASGGTLTVTNVISGAIAIGNTITGAGVTTGTAVTGLYSGGLGGVGVYAVNIGQTVASETITVVAGTATKWAAMSVGAPGELVKMSSHLLG